MTFQLIASILFSLLTSQTVHAQTLLVPDRMATFSEYSEKCKAEGYTCIQNYFLNFELHQPTPNFDAFVDSIDLTSKVFQESLARQIQTLMETEIISLDQVGMLIRLLEQGTSPLSKQLSTELKFVHSTLNSLSPVSVLQESFVLYFKKPISHAAFNRIRKSFLNFPYTNFHFAQMPEHRRLKDVLPNEPIWLVSGSCESSQLAMDTVTTTWKIYSEKSCGWTEKINTSTSSAFSSVKKNRNWWLTGAILVGAAIISRQYEVQFQF